MKDIYINNKENYKEYQAAKNHYIPTNINYNQINII